MKYIDCAKYAQEILDEVKQVKHNKCFAIVSVGDNPASQSYIKGKIKDCEYCGIPYIHKHIDLNGDTNKKLALEYTLLYLAADDKISAIILQLPLPDGWDEEYFLKLIPPHKDVDGLTNQSKFLPCTPEGVAYVLKKELGDLTGKTALIIGRGKLVGKPLINILLDENCTVTVAHSKTKDLESLIQSKFDIIVCAVGKPRFLNLQLCNAKIVVDVGVNRNENGKLCGDCWAFSENCNSDMRVTPVPKGIGLMTRAMLMKHIGDINKGEDELSDG